MAIEIPFSLRSKKPVKALLRDLEKGDWRAAAILGYRREKTAVPGLIKSLDRKLIESVPDRVIFPMAVLYALGIIGDAGAVPALLAIVKSHRYELKWMAAWALGEIGEEHVIPDLAKAMKKDRYGSNWIAGISLLEFADGMDEEAMDFIEAMERGIIYLDDASPIERACSVLGARSARGR